MPAVEWHSSFAEVFTPGEAGAEQQLARFLEHGMSNYQQGRDFPALESVSRLSPHIHFGEIAPHRIYKDSLEFGRLKGVESESEHFGRELVWREFSYSLLHYFPSLTENNMNRNFDHFPWQKDESLLRCWQTGQTGYPLVDAGMRELWQTGYMHNRVRMIVGSFLVKNLLQDWREGARWFWDCLLDADLANNTASWQWVAGCGADAAPYFRIFNPISQSEKFKAAPYIRRFVPELAQLDDKHIHEPSAAPVLIPAAAGVKLGENYPKPVVGLKASREKALEAYQQLKARNQAETLLGKLKRPNDCPGLVLRFFPFGFWLGVGHDTRPRLHMEHVILDDCRADRNGHIHIVVPTQITHGTAIDPPLLRLKLINDFHCTHLGRPAEGPDRQR